MTALTLQALACIAVAWPLIAMAPALDGNTRHKIDKMEDDRNEALRWLAMMKGE